LQFDGVGCKDESAIYLQATPMPSGRALPLFQRLNDALAALPWLAWDEASEPMTSLTTASSKCVPHATVATNRGSIPFYTLLGYVEERFEEECKEGPPSFLFDNVTIERKVPSAALDATEDYKGESDSWLSFSLRPPTSPIEGGAADLCLSDQRQKENEYHMKLKSCQLSENRAAQGTHFGWQTFRK